MCFSKHNISVLFDNLGRPLDLANTDRSLLNDKYDYVEANEISNLNSTGNNLTVLQLNIRSLLGKQNELIQLLKKLCQNKSLPKLILLSETHLNDSKLRHVNIPNYKILYQNRSNKLGGGVAILIHNSLMYKERHDLKSFNSEYLECVFLEMKRRGQKPIIIGSIYRPPNSKPKKFNYQYQSLLTN